MKNVEYEVVKANLNLLTTETITVTKDDFSEVITIKSLNGKTLLVLSQRFDKKVNSYVLSDKFVDYFKVSNPELADIQFN